MSEAWDDEEVAAAGERVRKLNEALRKRERELGILSEISARIHGEEEVERVLDIALEEILERFDLKAAWIFMGNDQDRQLNFAAARGVNPAYLAHVRQRGLGECLCPEVFWTGHRMQIRNTTECPRMPLIVEGLNTPVAHACVPLHFEGHRRGVLNVAARPGSCSPTRNCASSRRSAIRSASRWSAPRTCAPSAGATRRRGRWPP